MVSVLFLRYFVHLLDDGGHIADAFGKCKREGVEFEEVVIERITIAFLECHLFGGYVSRGLRCGTHVRFLVHAIGGQVREIMHHAGFVIVFEQSVLTLEIETFFIECSDEYLIEFVLFSGTFGISVRWSPGRAGLEIEYRWR